MGMVVERLSVDQVAVDIVRGVGLDFELLDPSSPEVLSALIRRAASFSCPTTPGKLVTTVKDCLRGLPLEGEELDGQLRSLTQALVGYGDLMELPVEQTSGILRRNLYLAPPSFVERASNTYFLLGIRPEGAPLVGDELRGRIQYEAHVRTLKFEADEPAREICEANELQPLAPEHWLHHPRIKSADDLIREYDDRLSAAGPAGEIDGITVLDPTAPSSYYRGRWRSPNRQDSGRFVGRRPQAFGSDLWCYAEMSEGALVRLIDLPIQEPLARGCDEAWRLQAAIDSLRGRPQKVRVDRHQEQLAIHLSSPLPSWSQRRLDAVGTRLIHHRGTLLSYALKPQEMDEELAFLDQLMWTIVQES